MGINVSMSGSGSFGEITPGWSEQEYATPVVMGESAGGSGGISFSAKANDDTLFVVNNSVTTIEQDLGSVSGTITSVSQNGLNASITHNNQLSKLDANLKIPALGVGGVVPALDLVSQLSKIDILLTRPEGRFYSLNGHSAGFDSSGNAVKPVYESGREYVYDYYGGEGIYAYKPYKNQIGLINAYNYFIQDGEYWAGNVDGDSLTDNPNSTSSVLNFKAIIRSDKLDVRFQGVKPRNNNNEGSYYITAQISKTQLLVYGTVTVGGYEYNINQTQSLASLDMNKEIGVFIQFNRPSTYSGPHTFTVLVANTSNYSNKVTIAVSYTAAREKGSYWLIKPVQKMYPPQFDPLLSNGVRAVYRAENLPAGTPELITVATNYMLNPSFKDGIAGWIPYGAAQVEASTVGYIGSNSLLVTFPTGSGPNRGASYRRSIADISDYTYMYLSGYFKSTASYTKIKIRVVQYNSSNQIISDITSYSGVEVWNTSWSRLEQIFYKVPGAVSVDFIFMSTLYTPQAFYVDNIMFADRGDSGYSTQAYFDGDTTDTDIYFYSYKPDGTSIQQTQSTILNQEYERKPSYIYDEIALYPPVPAIESNAWQYLQDACAAYGKEIALVNNIITIRPIGERVIDITNVVGAPTVTPEIMLSGRSTEISYSNSSLVGGISIYDARIDDNNRVISIGANETLTTTVELNVSPSNVSIPTRIATFPVGGVMPAGKYAVSDANGLPIPIGIWEDYGGSIDVAVSVKNKNAIDITVVSPNTTGDKFGEQGTALYPAPYKLAFSSDGSEYAALSVIGGGVKFDTKTLPLISGADPNKVSQDVYKTISNPFVSTLTQAYDRGIWVSNEASGPRVKLSCAVPVSAISNFGLTAGSLIKYRDSIYRVNSATIGNLNVSLDASRYVTVEDFDTVWASDNVERHDITWYGNDTSDHGIAPLRFIGDDESVMMFLDTDINPYYDFTGEPEISVFADTDWNPYYVEGGNLEGEDEVRLDTDDNPYDAGEGNGSE